MEHLIFQNLLDGILCADAGELRRILDTVMERFSELYPEQELMTLTVPGSDLDKQITVLQRTIALLSTLNES